MGNLINLMFNFKLIQLLVLVFVFINDSSYHARVLSNNTRVLKSNNRNLEDEAILYRNLTANDSKEKKGDDIILYSKPNSPVVYRRNLDTGPSLYRRNLDDVVMYRNLDKTQRNLDQSSNNRVNRNLSG